MGTGGFFPNASDTNTLKAYNNRCQLQWSTVLDGNTFSSPALSDVLGNGSLQVVEGTDRTIFGGSVWVLDAATGHKIWEVNGINRVIGSVVTADLSGAGYNDVIVPTIAGTLVLDGRTGAQIADLSPSLGLQNAPLVTDDPNAQAEAPAALGGASSAPAGGLDERGLTSAGKVEAQHAYYVDLWRGDLRRWPPGDPPASWGTGKFCDNVQGTEVNAPEKSDNLAGDAGRKKPCRGFIIVNDLALRDPK